MWRPLQDKLVLTLLKRLYMMHKKNSANEEKQTIKDHNTGEIKERLRKTVVSDFILGDKTCFLRNSLPIAKDNFQDNLPAVQIKSEWSCWAPWHSSQPTDG